MAKYVCDFSEVNRIGKELRSLAEELKTCVENFDSKVQSDLSSWNGTAKSSFVDQCKAQKIIANSNAEVLGELGDFVMSAANNIQQLDDEFASIKF